MVASVELNRQWRHSSWRAIDGDGGSGQGEFQSRAHQWTAGATRERHPRTSMEGARQPITRDGGGGRRDPEVT